MHRHQLLLIKTFRVFYMNICELARPFWLARLRIDRALQWVSFCWTILTSETIEELVFFTWSAMTKSFSTYALWAFVTLWHSWWLHAFDNNSFDFCWQVNPTIFAVKLCIHPLKHVGTLAHIIVIYPPAVISLILYWMNDFTIDYEFENIQVCRIDSVL